MSLKPTVPVFFGFDERFAPYAAVAMCSLIMNTDPKRNYEIHVLNTDIKKKTMREITSMKTENVTIKFDDVSKDIASIIAQLPIRDYYSPSTYFRLVIASKFPEYDKAIYIDGDTVVLTDVGKLYDINIGNDYVGAVPEGVCIIKEVSDYIKKVLDIEPKRYFNAGMLVINSKKWREIKLLHQFIKLVHFYTFTVAQDQDYLNVICKDHVHYLPRNWNMECVKDWNIPEKKRYIIHYAFAAKPWHDIESIHANYFWSYASKTPFFMEIKKAFAEYTLAQLENEKGVANKVINGCLDEIENPENYILRFKQQEQRNALQPDQSFGKELTTPSVNRA